MMNLKLKRKWLTATTTIGELFVDGKFECFICEDTFRPAPEPKVPGKTAIPLGRYEVVITHSPRFGVLMPLLMAVPGFTGIRVHPGNDAADTEGCLLPGRIRAGEKVLESKLAYEALFKKLLDAKAAGRSIFIEVELAPDLVRG